MARASGAQVILVHVLPQTTPVGTNEHSYALPRWKEFMKRERESAMAGLKREAGSKLLAGVKVETVLAAGSPYREIVRLASRKRVDLIVISTHGMTGLLHLMVGSVAERVVRLASCPVLVIKPPGMRKAARRSTA
jgi:nucleotide-binding universal stress UspA family protein